MVRYSHMSAADHADQQSCHAESSSTAETSVCQVCQENKGGAAGAYRGSICTTIGSCVRTYYSSDNICRGSSIPDGTMGQEIPSVALSSLMENSLSGDTASGRRDRKGSQSRKAKRDPHLYKVQQRTGTWQCILLHP